MIDGFCGSGGNVIQFSKYCSEVFAIDIDPKKLDICKNNCKIYNCKNNIHFIEYDFLKIQNYSKIHQRLWIACMEKCLMRRDFKTYNMAKEQLLLYSKITIKQRFLIG